MTEFHNPYHFVPVVPERQSGDLHRSRLKPGADAEGRARHLTHDRFAENTNSGRLLVRLRTETPLVVGGLQDHSVAPHLIHPFLCDGRPAVPASSLRGLISTIIEAITNSSLRVLHDKPYKGRDQGGRYDLESCHDFFRAISPELLPSNPRREFVTIAEQMFGFVDATAGQAPARAALALAGRLRFAHALPQPLDQAGPFEPPTTLKILDGPKPPCPPFYFKHRDGQGGHIAKRQLSTTAHRPQGRKFYLHGDCQQLDGTGKPPWETRFPREDSGQKGRVRPLRSGLTFFFHVDFDNLTNHELRLLGFALKPSQSFRHKLGMGKPLGLGTVAIEPVGLFLVNRAQRYIDSLFAPRYHTIFVEGSVDDWPVGRYPREVQEGRDHPSIQSLASKLEQDRNFLEGMRPDGNPVLPPTALSSLLLLGEPGRVTAPVHYPPNPKLPDERFLEKESFRWFVANDRAPRHRQSLEPLDQCEGQLPELERIAPPPRRNHSGPGRR